MIEERDPTSDRPRSPHPAVLLASSTLRSVALVLAVLFVPAPSLRASDHATELDSDRKPALVTGGTCIVRNVTIHTATKPAFVGDVWVRDGKIAAVGKVEASGAVAAENIFKQVERVGSLVEQRRVFDGANGPTGASGAEVRQ